MRRVTIFILLVVFWLPTIYSMDPIDDVENTFPKTNHLLKDADLLGSADNLYMHRKYAEAIKLYALVIADNPSNEAPIIKKMAISHAALGQTETSINLIEQFLKSEFDTDILKNSELDTIRNTPEFKSIEDKYSPKFTIWSFMYLYVALIGFHIAIFLNFNKKIDPIARVLISGFIFIHSFFILHICLNITNYQYVFPHSYLMSTSFSFLYGPLLFFYFKRITQQYKFKKKDWLHLIPTILFLIYIVPIYTLPGEEKLSLLLGRAFDGKVATDAARITLIVALKFVSLIVYGYFTRKLYITSKQNKDLSKSNSLWQKNIFTIHALYIVTYAFYGIVVSNQITSGFFYHSQIVCMSVMVLYLGYSANVQPSVFSGLLSLENQLFFKYENSGLTQSLSKELKRNLLLLFDNEKVYKENDINLESLARRLNTSRHNASQIINEHFNMNFHEFINKYRIKEAKFILDTDYQRRLHIIDIAYEVGFNNKVTFNKAFKKETNLTPSQYKKAYLRV